MTENERKDLYEVMLADISGVMRKYCKLLPDITSEEAIKKIKEILKEDPDQ